jgi:hypothetical protein
MSYSSIGEGSSSSKQIEENIHNRKGKEREKYPINSNTQDNDLEDTPLLQQQQPTQLYGGIIQPINDDTSSIQQRRSRQQKTCTYIAIGITTCGVVALFLLLWFAPTFAERSVKDGIEFSFQKASILNVTEDNVITMHVVGKIQLKQDLFSLQQKFNSLFGTIGIEQSELQVFYQQRKQEEQQQQVASMGKIDLPALDLNGVSSVTGFDFITRFVIDDDTEALMEFCKDAVVAKTVMWRVSGPLSVNLGWLPWKSNVDLDKIIELEGKKNYSIYARE